MIQIFKYEEVDLFDTEEEKERDERLHEAREKGIITDKQYMTIPHEDLLKIIEEHENSACSSEGHVNQYGGYENSPEEHVKYDPGYENTQGEHVKQNLTSDRYDSDSEEVSTDLAILKLLMEPGQTYTQKDIIAKTGKSRPTIWKYLKELERKKLIKFINLGRFKNYEITKRGISYYHEQYVNPVHRYEDVGEDTQCTVKGRPYRKTPKPQRRMEGILYHMERVHQKVF